MPCFNRYSLSLILLGLCACSTPRYRVMSVPLVSMTRTSLPSGYKIISGKPFFEQFCEDEKPIRATGDWIGMADQALLKAQKKNKTPFLLDVSVMREDKCVSAEGMIGKAFKISAKPKPKKKRDTAAEEEYASEDELPWQEDGPDKIAE